MRCIKHLVGSCCFAEVAGPLLDSCPVLCAASDVTRNGADCRNLANATTLIRFSAAAAIVAGVLRVGSSFLGARLGTTAAELLYLVIDTGFVLAIPGAYLSRHERLGIAGFVGFLLALCGAASIVGPDGELAGMQMYQLGGGVLVLGLGILGAAQLRLGAQRLGSSIGWLAALVATIAAAAGQAPWLYTLVGVLFGLSFIASGRELLSETRT